jgi:uncharacterized protein (TIGR03437 family)
MKVPPLLALVLGIASLVSPAAAQTAPLVFEQQEYQVQPGQSIPLQVSSGTRDFLRYAQRRLTLHGPSSKGLAVGPNAAGDTILLAASLLAAPGDYTVDLAAESTGGESRAATFRVQVLARVQVAATSTQPPVILINGWTAGTSSCSLAANQLSDTFGSLGTQLSNAGVQPLYFDVCAEAQATNIIYNIENLGVLLNNLIAGLEYSNGTLVPQVDLITYDMGGLVARAYLSGYQPSGAFATPINPRVRKFVEIAAPNFGSFLATQYANQFGSQGTAQTIPGEFAPGSPLLWNLARWNQTQDDLRGVDALAIIGSAGALNGATGGLTGQSDGVVATTSASLGFVAGISQTRTRILPYCHTSGNPAVSCASGAPPIADVDLAKPTLQILLSFLANTTAWQSIGTTPSTDPYLGTASGDNAYGGFLFALETASNLIAADLSSVTYGSPNGVPLQPGPPQGEFFYIDFVRGTGALIVNGSSENNLGCGTYTTTAGRYSTVRCKFQPFISGVTPLVSTSNGALLVSSGATITLSGSGFGTRCNGCQLAAYPQATTPGFPLTTTSWTNTAITATLPSTFQGFYQLVVVAQAGQDSINVVVQSTTAPTLNAGGVVNGASYAGTALAPGSIASAFGTFLTASTASASAVPLPNTLASAQLLVNGSVAPLFYVSATQMNFQVPFIDAGSATFQVVSAGLNGSTVTANFAATAPGVFSINSSGTGQGAVLNQDFSANSASNPAVAGSVIQIYCTGLGAVNPTLAAGSPGATSAPFNLTTVNPTVTINGVNAPVQFSAVAPGFVGLYQVNAQVPAGVSSSAASLQVSAGGVASNTVTIAVQ